MRSTVTDPMTGSRYHTDPLCSINHCTDYRECKRDLSRAGSDPPGFVPDVIDAVGKRWCSVRAEAPDPAEAEAGASAKRGLVAFDDVARDAIRIGEPLGSIAEQPEE